MPKLNYQYDRLMNPVINAIKQLGGSGTNEEINNRIIEMLDIPSNQAEVLHNEEKGGGLTELEYRLMWTRTYLKYYGILENSGKGVWALTPKGQKVERLNERDVVRYARERMRKKKTTGGKVEEPSKTVVWQEELLDTVMAMSADGFERLIQRLLRESGFIQVEVTGRTGDGGIDGHGILRLGGFLSFQVIFQGKKWKGSISASQIRDFRGAMVGRADKGLFITTGTFTREAIKEATRDGAPAIDLVDGDQLVEKLKQLSLGVETKIVEVEEVSIKKEWFKSI
jgi:restriction system protein